MKIISEQQPYNACLLWSCVRNCNLGCFYCFRNQGNSGLRARILRRLSVLKRPQPIRIDPLLKTLENSGKIFNIVFTGWGEPFLLPNLIQVCEALTKKHYVSIVSNLTSPKIREFSLRIDPGRVIYVHASAHILELFEKPKLLQNYLDNFALLKEKGFNIYAYVVAHPALLPKLTEYKRFLHEKRIEPVLFGHFLGSYKGKKYPQDYTQEEFAAFGFKKLKMYMQAYEEKVTCNAGRNILVVKEDGQIQPCYKLSQPLGHIYREIRFNDHLKRCPEDFCFNPICFRDPELFEQAKQETKIVRDSVQ